MRSSPPGPGIESPKTAINMFSRRIAIKRSFGLPGITLFMIGLMSLSSCSQSEILPEKEKTPSPVHLPATQADDDDNTDKPPKDAHGGN